MKDIIVVDKNDSIIGYETKEFVHEQKILHRAFSAFVYSVNKHKLLIQQRARIKYHSAMLWSNSFCSHPHKNETMLNALTDRFRNELGILLTNASIEYEPIIKMNTFVFAGKFMYSADLGRYSENEIDSVYVYFADDNFPDILEVNTEEVASYEWIDIDSLKERIALQPEKFTAWLPNVLSLSEQLINNVIKSQK